MPRFNWILLFNNLPDKKVLVIGNHQDANDVIPIADHVYLLVNGTDFVLNQTGKVDNDKITVVQDNEVNELDIDIAIVCCSNKLSNKLRIKLETTFPPEKCHVVHQYKNSTLFNRILQVIAISRVSDSLLYFPYKSFDSNHFIDVFKNGLRMKGIFQLVKHTLARAEFGVYIPKSGCVSNIENIIDNVSNVHGLNFSVPSRIRNGSTGSYLADLGGDILRVPHSDFANDRFCKNNFSVLQKLSEMDLPFKVPDPVGEGIYGGNHYYIESKILGMSLDLIKPDIPILDAVFEHALSALNDPRMQVGFVTEQSAHSLVNREMLGLVKHLTPKQRRLYEDFGAAFVKLSVDMKLPLVITHGDFKNSNFIISLDSIPTIRGVIDWEFSPLVWFPFYDFLVLVFDHYCRLKGKYELAKYVSDVMQGQCLDNINGLISQYAGALGLDKSVVFPIMIICMLRHMNVNFDAQHKHKQVWADVFADTIDPMATKYLRSY